MKKLVLKPIIVCLLVLMISLLAFVSTVKILSNVSTPKSTSAATTMDISSAADWENFRKKTINDNSTNARLTRNIDFGGAEITPICAYVREVSDYDYQAYSGTFEGNGYTLSNFKIKGTWDFLFGTNGLFGYTYKAKIKNLRIKNATYTASGSSANKLLCIGGIVAVDCEDSSISNCFVDNVSLGTTDSWSEVACIGGLVGYEYMGGTGISDCYVKKLKINASFISNYYSGNNRIFVGGIAYDPDERNNSIQRCVFDPTEFQMEVICKVNDYNGWVEKKRMTYKNGVLSGNNSSVSNTVGIYTLFEYIGKGASNCICSSTTQLGRAWSNVCSSQGGANAADYYGSVYTWYFNTKYNNSMPILRKYVDGWKDYIFTSTNTSVAKVSGSYASLTITVPSDYSDSYVHLKSGDNTKYVVEGVSDNIYVTISNSDYEFTGWKKSGNVVTAQIELSLFKITFNLADYINETGLSNTRTFEIKKASNVLNITVADFEIVITFSDKDGAAKEIKYTISDSKYAIDKLEIYNSSNVLKQTITNTGTYSVVEEIKISVFAKLKDYNVLFK